MKLRASHSAAPTARPISAQGNALGCGSAIIQALKGRAKDGFRTYAHASEYTAPSGLDPFSFNIPRALPWAGIARADGPTETAAVTGQIDVRDAETVP